MAHKVFSEERESIRKSRLNLPSFEGKFGFSIFIGGKELFIGIQITEVIIEKIIRRKLIKPIKGKAKTFDFD